MLPFFENIKNVKWITLDNAAHMSHVDQRERYMWHLKRFLNGEDRVLSVENAAVNCSL